jgi:hypothetical protein
MPPRALARREIDSAIDHVTGDAHGLARGEERDLPECHCDLVHDRLRKRAKADIPQLAVDPKPKLARTGVSGGTKTVPTCGPSMTRAL